MARFVYIIILFVFLCIACKQGIKSTGTEVNGPAEIEDISNSQNLIATSKDEEVNYYVLAPSGLNLRSGPGLQSAIIRKIPYGEPVTPEGQKEGDFLVVDNIKGQMLSVSHKGQAGYLFSGYLSPVPVPDIRIEYRDSILLAYARSLKKAGIDCQLEITEGDASLHCSLVLPLESYETAFLIGKLLFFIPEEYHFPTQDQEIKSTPEHPSKAAQQSPYDYIEHYFKITRAAGGQIESLAYYNRHEVSNQAVTIRKIAGGFHIESVEEGR